MPRTAFLMSLCFLSAPKWPFSPPIGSSNMLRLRKTTKRVYHPLWMRRILLLSQALGEEIALPPREKAQHLLPLEGRLRSSNLLPSKPRGNQLSLTNGISPLDPFLIPRKVLRGPLRLTPLSEQSAVGLPPRSRPLDAHLGLRRSLKNQGMFMGNSAILSIYSRITKRPGSRLRGRCLKRKGILLILRRNLGLATKHPQNPLLLLKERLSVENRRYPRYRITSYPTIRSYATLMCQRPDRSYCMSHLM